MSIRLRLTLLYSTILLVCLVVFGTLIYVIQVQSTFRIEQQALLSMAERSAAQRQRPPSDDRKPPPSSGSERYIQVRSPDGQQILESQTPEGVVIPLSDDALRAAQQGEPSVEIILVAEDRLLVSTVPVMVDGELVEILQLARSLAVRDESLRALAIGLLAAGVVATMAAFALGWVLAGMALRPIQRITQTAQAIGAERDFARRVDYGGPNDEVGELATTFNAMLAELQAAYQQVAQALDQQRRFVADVSHELRTPLTTLNGNVELLRREPSISAEDRTEVLADMAGESQRLIRLVNDLLALARADARRPLKCESIRLWPVIKDVCRQAQLLDPGRSIECDPLVDVVVSGDVDALKQVFLILLDNACKHGEGAIAVSAEVRGGWVAVAVSDTGPGIDPELVPYLFERFSRGRAQESRTGTGAGGGAGLGLSIAKALVDALDGTIAVQSHVGQGSVFTVSLPLAELPNQQ